MSNEIKSQFIETEIKFIANRSDVLKLRDKISILGDKIKFIGKKYEKTIMFDNEEKIMDKRDARLRVRVVKECIDSDNDLFDIEFTYKRRLNDEFGDNIKREEEIETFFEFDDSKYNNFILILNKMGFSEVSSYERYRETYIVNSTQVKLTIDEFPFGYIIEIENDDIDNINNFVKLLDLGCFDTTLESCDDIYDRICREKGIEPKNNICFDDPDMPQL